MNTATVTDTDLQDEYMLAADTKNRREDVPFVPIYIKEEVGWTPNPKLEGANMLDCNPQVGPCPGGCAECFYNGGRFYRDINVPLIPSLERASGMIVRMNSGHDSNIERALVRAVGEWYPQVFYNTSLPHFDFDGPVVYTCNGRGPVYITVPHNIMFVRIRANTWDLRVQDALVDYYREQGVPVVLTWMRYYTGESVLREADYEFKKSVLNRYWMPRPEAKMAILERYEGLGVYQCGTMVSSFCVDCGLCEMLYWQARALQAGM